VLQQVASLAAAVGALCVWLSLRMVQAKDDANTAV
jgi:hypothetical protein